MHIRVETYMSLYCAFNSTPAYCPRFCEGIQNFKIPNLDDEDEVLEEPLLLYVVLY